MSFLHVSSEFCKLHAKIFRMFYLSGAILRYLKVILKINKKNPVVTLLVNFR